MVREGLFEFRHDRLGEALVADTHDGVELVAEAAQRLSLALRERDGVGGCHGRIIRPPAGECEARR